MRTIIRLSTKNLHKEIRNIYARHYDLRHIWVGSLLWIQGKKRYR